jgi:hypothetical protein
MSDLPTDPPTERPPTMAHRVFIYAALVVTVLLALFLVIATGVRWITQPTPSSIVVFRLSPKLAGAQIIATGATGSPRTITIPSPVPGTTPMFLEEGTYTLKAMQGNATIYRDEIYVAQGRRYDIDLAGHPTTAP